MAIAKEKITTLKFMLANITVQFQVSRRTIELTWGETADTQLYDKKTR